MSKKRNGFTLIELLVVISIIAILSVVGLVVFQNAQKSAKDAKIKADLNAIKKAYETNYDPTLNGGQGGYKPLNKDTDFAGGKIPTQPNGSPYPCDLGPDSTCKTVDNTGYQVSATISDGKTEKTIYASSAQGSLASQGGLGTCDPGGTLRNGLVGYWKFNEGAGTTTADATGNGGNASLVNGPTWLSTSVNSSFGSALTFNGSNYVQAPQNSTLNSGITGSVTVSMWINPTSWTSFPGLFRKEFSWLIDGGLGCVRNGGINPSCSYLYFPSIPLNTWTNIVLTYDPAGGNNNLKVYTQGVFGGATTSTGNFINATDSAYIGGPGGNSSFSGSIDDVRVYNRALSQSDIDLLQSCPAP